MQQALAQAVDKVHFPLKTIYVSCPWRRASRPFKSMMYNDLDSRIRGNDKRGTGKHAMKICQVSGFVNSLSVSCQYCGDDEISDTLDACEGYLDETQRWKLCCATRIRHNRGEAVYLRTGNYLDCIENTRFPGNPLQLVDELLKRTQ